MPLFDGGPMGILIAALITGLLAIVALAAYISSISDRGDRHALLIVFLIALPLQPILFYLIRQPIHAFLAQTLGAGGLLTAIAVIYAPVTEEAGKWIAFASPTVRKALRPESATAFALSLGLGFGVGEIAFLAERLARAPQLAALPFWAFGGFLFERLLVCFLHGAFVVWLFQRVAERKSAWPGALLAMVLHFALNFPIYLAGINLFGIGREVWSQLLVLYVAGFALVMFLVIHRLARDKRGRA
jgi:hypothetical protein